jgi:hypothetical protein
VVKPPGPKGAGSAIFSQPLFHAIEASLPERAVGVEPFGCVPERYRTQSRWTLLRGAAAFDQARALEHAKVLGPNEVPVADIAPCSSTSGTAPGVDGPRIS